MALFKRAPEPQPPSPPSMPVGTAPCSERGCPQQNGVLCDYTDRLGQRCTTAWCPDHIRAAGGGYYCRRHASVVTALLASSSKGHLPDLDNRAASLANWVGNDLDAGMRDVLAPLVRHDHAEELVAAPLAFFYTADDQRHRWERGWRIEVKGIPRVAVSVDVAEARDSVVRVCVDGRAVGEEIPPWVGWQNRQKLQADPDLDARSRHEFYAKLLALVSEAVTGR